MTAEPLPLPETCLATLQAVEANPLQPGPAAEAHMQICTACSEARVAYLAQEETTLPLVPAGYFERLPGRVLGKLPVRTTASPSRKFYWGTAAALLLAVGATAFWVGRANRTPLVEASLPRAPQELTLVLADSPFQDPEDAVSQLTDLSPEDADAVMRALADRQVKPHAGK